METYTNFSFLLYDIILIHLCFHLQQRLSMCQTSTMIVAQMFLWSSAEKTHAWRQYVLDTQKQHVEQTCVENAKLNSSKMIKLWIVVSVRLFIYFVPHCVHGWIKSWTLGASDSFCCLFPQPPRTGSAHECVIYSCFVSVTTFNIDLSSY